MIIDGVKKRKSGTISINYTDGGKLYGLTLTPQEIVENFKAAQQLRALDGGVCTCKKPIPTTSSDNHCGNCGKPRRQ